MQANWADDWLEGTLSVEPDWSRRRANFPAYSEIDSGENVNGAVCVNDPSPVVDMSQMTYRGSFYITSAVPFVCL